VRQDKAERGIAAKERKDHKKSRNSREKAQKAQKKLRKNLANQIPGIEIIGSRPAFAFPPALANPYLA
jgi:hypothetical protein